MKFVTENENTNTTALSVLCRTRGKCRLKSLHLLQFDLLTRSDLHQDTSATRTPFIPVSVPASLLRQLGILLIDNVLWFDGHVNDVGCVIFELGF